LFGKGAVDKAADVTSAQTTIRLVPSWNLASEGSQVPPIVRLRIVRPLERAARRAGMTSL
jgi:hypothetical protein